MPTTVMNGIAQARRAQLLTPAVAHVILLSFMLSLEFPLKRNKHEDEWRKKKKHKNFNTQQLPNKSTLPGTL